MSWTGSRKEFINEFGPYIFKVTKGTGILPGTLITQAFIESASKKTPSIVGSSGLTKATNNYFGIKCYGNWSGPCFTTNTNEVVNGKTVTIKDRFRQYGSIEASINDYVKFLQENKRYANAGVFEAKTVKEQAEALKRAGYATGEGYAQFIYNVYKPYAELIESKRNLAGINWKTTIGLILMASGLTILYNKLKP